MGAVQIVINQAGKSPGVAGQAREDLATGTAVVLQAVGGTFFAYQWTIVWRPFDIIAAIRSSCVLTAPTQAITQLTPIDVASTYFVEVVVDSGAGLGAGAGDVARITLYAGPTLSADPAKLPRRTIAAGETVEHNAPDAIDPLGNPDGWAKERARWDAVLQSMYAQLIAGISWTKTTANFTAPAVNSTVNVAVLQSQFSTVGLILYVAGAGYYAVTAVPDSTHVTLQNLGYVGNASPSTVVSANALVTPGGLRGTQGPQGNPGNPGSNAFTALSTTFTQPAAGATVTVTVAFSGWAVVGQAVFVQAAGYYLVTAVPNVSQITLKNLGYPGNGAPTTTVGTPGGGVSPAGLQLAREVVFYSNVEIQNGGAGDDGPAGLQVVDAATYALATTATFEGTFWTDRSNSPPNWAQNTVYTAGDWVQNTGPGSAFVAYVCTTGGLSSATGAGPSTLGTGISDGAGGTTVWRSAVVTIVLVDFTNPSLPVSLASFATSYTLAAAIAGGVTPVLFSVDITAAFFALVGPRVLLVAFELDVLDTGSTRYTSAQSSLAKLVVA